MSKKVFVISPVQVYPAIGANQKDIAGHIQLFKELNFNITLIYFQTPRHPDPEIEKFAAELSIDIIELQRGEPYKENKYTKWYQVKNHCTQEAIDFINKKIRDEKPDVLFFEYARLACLAKKIDRGSAKLIFHSHNFELMHHYDRELLNAENAGIKYFAFLRKNKEEFTSIFRNEKLMFKVADWVFSISHADTASMKKYYTRNNISFLPPYLYELDFQYEKRERDRLDVVYMGSNLANNINKDGADYLINNIIPMVNKHMKGKFKFHITGNNAKEVLKGVDIENLEIHGFVENYYEFLKGMDACCIPVRYGRGCKIKMFEALKAGIPTVGFPKTFKGVPFKPNCFETAESPEDFMIGLQRILLPEIRNELSENSVKLIEEIAAKDVLLKILSKKVL